MPCVVDHGARGLLFLCYRRRERAPRCKCGRKATKLCDFPVDDGTCDRAICDRCATQVGDPVTRRSRAWTPIRHSVAVLNCAVLNNVVDIHGEPFEVDYEDTVDHCPEHAS